MEIPLHVSSASSEVSSADQYAARSRSRMHRYRTADTLPLRDPRIRSGTAERLRRCRPERLRDRWHTVAFEVSPDAGEACHRYAHQ